MPQGLPQVGALRVYDKAFASQNDILIAVTQPNIAVGDEATASLAKFLQEREALFRSLSSKPPWEENPAQMGELLAYLWANGPPEKLQALVDKLTGEGVERELAVSLDILENSMDMKDVTRVSHDPLNLSDFGDDASTFQLEDATKLGFVSDDGELRIILAEPTTNLKDPSSLYYTNTRNALIQIVNREGFFGLYKGILPRLLSIGPTSAINFAGYNTFTEIYYYLKQDQLNIAEKFLCGSLSGMF